MLLSILDHIATWGWGAFGGILAEFLKWYSMRETLYKSVPDYGKSLLYWVATAGMIVVGGFFAIVYEIQGTVMSPMLAINIGASAPLILKQVANTTPTIDKGSKN